MPRNLQYRGLQHGCAADALSAVCGTTAKSLLARAAGRIMMVEVSARRCSFRIRADGVGLTVFAAGRERPLGGTANQKSRQHTAHYLVEARSHQGERGLGTKL